MAVTQYETILKEISALFADVDDAAVGELIARLAKARRIVTFGAGRERLQIMGFTMRLFHLGMNASVAGDMTTPPVGEGDVLLATCGPGDLSTVTALAKQAKEAEAEVIMITAQPGGASIELADFVLTLPAQTMADDQDPSARSLLPMGSLFEGALFVLFEAAVLRLKETLGVTAAEMRANHTNLE